MRKFLSISIIGAIVAFSFVAHSGEQNRLDSLWIQRISQSDDLKRWRREYTDLVKFSEGQGFDRQHQLFNELLSLYPKETPRHPIDFPNQEAIGQLDELIGQSFGAEFATHWLAYRLDSYDGGIRGWAVPNADSIQTLRDYGNEALPALYRALYDKEYTWNDTKKSIYATIADIGNPESIRHLVASKQVYENVLARFGVKGLPELNFHVDAEDDFVRWSVRMAITLINEQQNRGQTPETDMRERGK